eukprot:gene9286-1374_t
MSEELDNKIYESLSEESYVDSQNMSFDDSQVSILSEFVKQLKPGVELFRISVPAVILQPCSLLEKNSTYVRPNKLILDIKKETSKEKRFIQVLSWVLSNYSTVPRKGIYGCKPYNPILGEVFECIWEHDDSQTIYVSEQVSHHPPITAFYLINEKAGFAFSGHVNPKQTFSVNSVETVLEGQMRIDLSETKEQFIWKPQTVSVSGIFMGEQSIQFCDQAVLISKDYKATVDFYVNKDNQLDGGIYDLNSKKRIFSINGNVDDKVYLTSSTTGSKKVLHDSKELKFPKVTVEDVSKQSPNSSRRNWHKLTKALVEKDFEKANVEKNIVEERERAIRKERKEKGEVWKPVLFQKNENNNWVYKKSKLPKEEDIVEVNQEDKSWGGYISSFFY